MSSQSNTGSVNASSNEPASPHARNGRQPPGMPPSRGKVGRSHTALLRTSAIIVAGVLSMLMVSAVAPPLVADQSDRAIVNAPVTLLTSPINGEVGDLSAIPGNDVSAGDRLARISNPRVDRGTLISLEERAADAREKLESTRAKKQSDRTYLASLDAEITGQAQHLKAQFASQIEELRARVAQSNALSGEKKALVDRQSNMVARNAASTDMLKPTTEQYSAALQNAAAENAKLNQKAGQLEALNKGVYVGDDLVAINTLAQKRRDIDLDSRRMDIEEKELSALVDDLQGFIEAERGRLASLAAADVRSVGPGKVLTIGVASGRHVSAGDTIASVVDCDKAFIVAIFSYRQGQALKVGTHVTIDGSTFHSGLVTAVLPKTSDKVDERFAIPFPQTERRELYTVIKPEDPSGESKLNASTSPQLPTCTIGQWVTVTRDNGIVPSMSVSWRRLANLVSSWMGVGASSTEPATPGADAALRGAGMARLAAAFHSTSPALKLDEAGRPRTQSPVPR